jgi:nucleotide-binding universal stress UspA family protein
MTTEILIFTNGRPTTLPAIEYGAWLGVSLQVPVRLIGLNEDPSPSEIDEERHPLESVFTDATEKFKRAGIPYQLEVQNGHAEDVIPRRVSGQDVIVVAGPLGRPPLKRLLSGRSFRYIMEQVQVPILYVPQARLPLKRMLVCQGGLGYEVTAENLAMKIAESACPEVVLLAVVPPIDLNYPSAREVREHWQTLAETDTPSGRSLRLGLEIARTVGLQASVKVRNGNVLEEISAEIRDGNYDLVCMGSIYSSHALRQYYSPNITAEIAVTDIVPVLTARYMCPE